MRSSRITDDKAEEGRGGEEEQHDGPVGEGDAVGAMEVGVLRG